MERLIIEDNELDLPGIPYVKVPEPETFDLPEKEESSESDQEEPVDLLYPDHMVQPYLSEFENAEDEMIPEKRPPKRQEPLNDGNFSEPSIPIIPGVSDPPF